MITSISAITLATHDMARTLRFYSIVGFPVIYGGPAADFSSLRAGEAQYLNLIAQPMDRQWSWWGRLIFYESDVDALHKRLTAAAFRRTPSRAMRNGASASSTSPTRTDMS